MSNKLERNRVLTQSTTTILEDQADDAIKLATSADSANTDTMERKLDNQVRRNIRRNLRIQNNLTTNNITPNHEFLLRIRITNNSNNKDP